MRSIPDRVKMSSVNGRQIQSFNLYVRSRETSAAAAVCGFSWGSGIMFV